MIFHLPASHPAPDAHRVLAWMCVIIAVNQLGFGALIPVLPLYARSFGVSISAIGATIAIFGLARLMVAIPTGRGCDLWGRRPVIVLGGVISALGNFVCASTSDYGLFLVGRFIAGAGASMVLTAGVIVIADISPPERRGRMMAIYNGVFLFAVGIGPFPGGLLAERFGLAAPFYVYAVSALVAGGVAWWAVPETRRFGQPARAAAFAGSPLGSPDVEPRFTRQFRWLFGRIGYALVCLIGLVSTIVRTGGLFVVVPLVAAARLGLDAAQIGAGLALGSLLGVVFSYPAGSLADHRGRKWVIVPASLLTGASFATFWFAPSFAGFVAGCVVWGVASTISASAPAAYVTDCAPPGMNAAAMSGYRMIADVGYVIGPLGLGWLADRFGAGAALLSAAILMVASGLAFARWAPETVRRRE